MKCFLAVLLVCAGCAALATAQDASGGGLGGYNRMQIDFIGELIGETSGAFESMTGGVEITLLADDPNLKPLPIKARTMKFEYGEDHSKPTRIVMEGGVNVSHPSASVKSDNAEWDFGKGEMTFRGDVVMNNDRMKDVRCDEFILNFNDNRYRMTKVKADEVSVSNSAGGGDTGSGAALGASDVSDWNGLVSAFKAQSAASAASPGKHIFSLLDEKARNMLATTPVETIVANKDQFLKQINKVMQNASFYNADAWAGVSLGDETKTLLAKADRTTEEQARLHELLLHDAYPNFVAAP